MKYLAAILLLFSAGCAAKNNKQVAAIPGSHHYTNCVEVSIDARTNKVTVVCPLNQEAKK